MSSDWHNKNKLYNSLIKTLFHSEDWQERAEAARKLGFLKDGRATNLLCRALRKEEDHMVMNRIIEALGRIGDPRATMRIIEKLKEELDKFEGDKFKIKYIIEALMRLKDKRALAYIGPFLRSSDDDLKKLAREAFDVIEPKWEEILEKEMTKDKSIANIFKKKYK
ncbi:MAG: HEAT repeat domain-containing protein [Promethearchaeia archaeon]